MQLVDRFCPAELDDNVVAFNVTKFSQPRPQCLYAGRRTGGCVESQVADARYFGRLLLCARHERPRCRRAAKQRDELAPV
jgi:hypothetical protein